MTSDRLALGLIAAGYAGLGAAIALYWQADPSAADRYLVLAGAVWALLSRWREAVGSPFPSPRIGLPLVALGALLYPVGWAGYFVLFKARSVPFWLMWVALSAALAGWLVAVYGRRAGLRLLFPLLFVGFALPLPDSVLHPFRERLQAVTTDVSEWLLRACGYSVSRPSGGFVLALAGGDLGIEEACSGVKALTALTAVAAFLAFRQRFGLLRGGLLVAAAVPVVVAVNVARVTLSGVIQEAAGPEYIRGGWHDALGFATVLGGLGVVLLVTKVLRPRSEMTDPSVAPLAVPTPASRNPVTLRTAGVLLTLSLVATAVVVWHSRTRIPPPVPAPDLADLPTDIGGWSEYRRLDVPYHIADMLQPNVILHREYRNNVGRSVTVWVIYWEAVHAMRGYHHPDVCLPKVGYRETRCGVEWLYPTGG
ncbi:MAG: exosortase-associated EpsI family protein, partial [Fimbriiglobus sp.]|nr:exosortase-associated EpsI family protein [Fimbriiglobus sp.]